MEQPVYTVDGGFFPRLEQQRVPTGENLNEKLNLTHFTIVPLNLFRLNFLTVKQI